LTSFSQVFNGQLFFGDFQGFAARLSAALAGRRLQSPVPQQQLFFLRMTGKSGPT
jgi:hypothetical protein